MSETARKPIRDSLLELIKGRNLANCLRYLIIFYMNLYEMAKVLLLIDGLDEISDESDRIAFIRQLWIFLSYLSND